MVHWILLCQAAFEREARGFVWSYRQSISPLGSPLLATTPSFLEMMYAVISLVKRVNE